MLSECIILNRKVCSHKEISGNLCSECKIPDNGKYCNVCGWYNTEVELSHNNNSCFNCNSKFQESMGDFLRKYIHKSL